MKSYQFMRNNLIKAKRLRATGEKVVYLGDLRKMSLARKVYANRDRIERYAGGG